MTTILVILVLMLLVSIPVWPHSNEWGYGASGGLTLVLIALLALILLEKL